MFERAAEKLKTTKEKHYVHLKPSKMNVDHEKFFKGTYLMKLRSKYFDALFLDMKSRPINNKS